MKTLFIIRHAKSDQSFFGNDFERPLNERGKTDAPLMAKRLLAKKLPIDAFVSSPAKRAKKTAELFSNEFNASKESILFFSELYHAESEIFYDVISGLDDAINSAAVFSHNIGITDFVNTLFPDFKLNNMSTCSIVATEIDTNHWANFESAVKTFLFYDYPKNEV